MNRLLAILAFVFIGCGQGNAQIWPTSGTNIVLEGSNLRRAYADALVDVAADSRLTDPQNTTYYFEGVHQNGAGRGIVGGLVSAVLQTI